MSIGLIIIGCTEEFGVLEIFQDDLPGYKLTNYLSGDRNI